MEEPLHELGVGRALPSDCVAKLCCLKPCLHLSGPFFPENPRTERLKFQKVLVALVPTDDSLGQLRYPGSRCLKSTLLPVLGATIFVTLSKRGTLTFCKLEIGVLEHFRTVSPGFGNWQQL